MTDNAANTSGNSFDVIIVGGGPAGLSAALMLGRCRRSVLIIDAAKPRNAATQHVHGYLTRDGIAPQELRALGRLEVGRYDIDICHGTVSDARINPNGFGVTLDDGREFVSRKLVLATGITENLPAVEGMHAFYGTSVHHCQYCDAWEWRDKRIAVYGHEVSGAGQALSLKTWSPHITLFSDGAPVSEIEQAKLAQHNIAVITSRIQRVEGEDGLITGIVLVDGTILKCDALFFNAPSRQKSSLAASLGCVFDEHGGVVVDDRERTGVQGLFVVGDALKDVQFAMNAAAQGAIAGETINREFEFEEGRML